MAGSSTGISKGKSGRPADDIFPYLHLAKLTHAGENAHDFNQGGIVYFFCQVSVSFIINKSK